MGNGFPLIPKHVYHYLVKDVSLVAFPFPPLFRRLGVPLPAPYTANGVEKGEPLFVDCLSEQAYSTHIQAHVKCVGILKRFRIKRSA